MYSIGIDFGTNSCRGLVLDLETGNVIGSSVFPYPTGDQGILIDPADANVARQNPRDYVEGCRQSVSGALEEAEKVDPNFQRRMVVGIGVDTTGSTIIPVDQNNDPLAYQDQFANNLNAQVWLWKDHTAYAEADEITRLAKGIRPEYLSICGGTYSSEWFWAKILHLKRFDPSVYNASESFIEHCDWLPAILCGIRDPKHVKRSICAAGHKALFDERWNGLPDKEFLNQLDDGFGELRDRLYSEAFDSTVPAGNLSQSWADEFGIPQGIPVAVGGFDCHIGAVAAGVEPGALVKVLGTSTCDITVCQPPQAVVPGLCGQVDSSVLPGKIGLEAGQSAVGDLFLWFLKNLVPDSYGETLDQKFSSLERQASELLPGESGLLALDWNNGNRSILTDVRLTGLILGQTLHTKAHEIYRALIEATAFGALKIINQIRSNGVPIDQVITTGGISLKSPLFMQIYADVLGVPLLVSDIEHTCAMGAAMFGAAATEKFEIEQLQKKCVRFQKESFHADPANQKAYRKLFELYSQLHDGFGGQSESGDWKSIMKALLDLKETQRKNRHE